MRELADPETIQAQKAPDYYYCYYYYYYYYYCFRPALKR